MSAPNIIQQSTLGSASVSNTDITLSGVVAGSTLVVVVWQNSTSTRTYTVSDNVNGSWGSAVASGIADSFRRCEIFRFENSGSGNITITIDQSTTLIAYSHIALELEPSTFEVGSNNFVNVDGTTHYCANSGAVDTTNNVLLLGGIQFNNNAGTISPVTATNLFTPTTLVGGFYLASDTALTDERMQVSCTTARQSNASLAVFKAKTPLNTVAPVLSGTEQEDETLSCTSGTWDSQSNGALSYQYQWTRSNDSGGTGEADIGGATGATYVLTATDVGKFIRCRVRASNDGGYDAAEDTNSNMSGEIAAATGGPTYTLTAEAGSFSLTGNAATLKAGRKLAATAGSYSLTGNAATLKAARKLTVAAGSFTYTGNDATLTYTPTGGPDYTIACVVGNFTLTGNAAGVFVGRKILAANATYSLAGNAAGLRAGRKIATLAGSYSLTGQATGLRASRKITASSGSYLMTGNAASLVYSGAAGSRASYYYYMMMGK